MKEEAPPENANSGCVGPSSANAGVAPGCAGCPNASVCASGATAANLNPQSASSGAKKKVASHTIMVLSGKGGVGKSTVACQLAWTLAARGYHVGILDVDLCGPSAPRMLGAVGRTVHRSAEGWCPVYVRPNLCVMSIGFLLAGADDAVVWRGPRKNGLLTQFFTETQWSSFDNDDDEGQTLDYLLIDTPPGTSDEHISTVQLLQQHTSEGIGGAIVVTTPEEVSQADVRRELNFCKKTGIEVIGVLENMAGCRIDLEELKFYRTVAIGSDNNSDLEDRCCTKEVQALLKERCPELFETESNSTLSVSLDIFPRSGAGPRGMAERFGVPYLGTLPLDPKLLQACEDGVCFVDTYGDDNAAARSLHRLVDGLLCSHPIDEDDDSEQVEQ